MSEERTRAESPLPRRGRTSSLLLSVAFAIAILLPLVARVARWEPVRLYENRAFKRFPRVTRAADLLTTFPRGVDGWWSDTFGLRGALIRLHGILTVELLGVAPNHEVVVGKEGWLFLGGDDVMAAYQAQEPLTDEQLAGWERLLRSRHRMAEAHGAMLVVAFIPEKQTIYPSKMPPVPRGPGPSRLEQLQAHLEGKTPYELVDLLGILRAARERSVVYAERDSHWNQRGAMLAAEGILQAVATRHAGVPVPHLDDFRETLTAPMEQDLPRLAGLQGRLLSPRLQLARKSPSCARKGAAPDVPLKKGMRREAYPYTYVCRDPRVELRALVFHDSFGTLIAPFLAESFARTTYLRHTHYPWRKRTLEVERPDVVILLIAERHLQKRIPPA